MSVRNAKEKGCLENVKERESEVGVQRQKSKWNFCCCRMASGGWEWPGSYQDQKLYPEGRRGDQRAFGSYARCSIPACARMVPTHELREHAIRDHLPRFFFFGTPTQVSAAMATLANSMVGHGGVRELYNLTRAEYFIPAYHFGQTLGGRVSGTFLFVPPQLHRPRNTLGSSNGAVVSCGSEGTKNVSGLWYAEGRHFVFLCISGSTSLAGIMGSLQIGIWRCQTGRERRLWRATSWASPSMCTPTTGFRGDKAGWRRLSWQALDRRKLPAFFRAAVTCGDSSRRIHIHIRLHVQTEKSNCKDAEVPPLNRRINEPASQRHGEKQGKKPAEPKSRTERSDRTPRNRTERPDQNSRKRTPEITERREQEAELEQHTPTWTEQEAKLEQHAPTQPKKQKQKLTLAALTFTREQWAQFPRQKRKRYANWWNRLRRGEQPLKHPVKKGMKTNPRKSTHSLTRSLWQSWT